MNSHYRRIELLSNVAILLGVVLVKHYISGFPVPATVEEVSGCLATCDPER